ncbi:oligosaccharide flippase family protein [Cereibacter sediminicola]|uniref:oligosaccharide flippase family protein n=1 Tax=Cereibacter sediminicola TaxID=2584941 RepID=UPI00248240A4|nr:oligosaccharide flippase family protein [Cereibacter sediminicola]
MKGGILTTMARVLSQGSQLAIFLLAAHVMGPAQFGVFALVSAVALIALRMSEAGWAEFVMSWTGDDEVPGQVLTVAILSGLVVGCAGLGLSLAVQAWPGLGDAGRLGMLFSLWICLATTWTAHNGLMLHQQRLAASASVLMLGEAAGFVVSVWALLEGHGIFAMAYGRVVQQSVQLALAVRILRTRPRLGMKREVLGQLMRFSGNILAARTISTIRVYAATFVIGAFLGPASVGFFRLAQRLVGAFAEVMSETARIIAWSMFRSARTRHGSGRGFQEEAAVFFPALLVLAVPVFVWIALEAQPLVTGLLGPEWAPAAPVILIVALSQCLLLPTYASEPLLSLAGEVRRIPRVSLFNAGVAIGLALVTGPVGIMAVALGQALAAAIALATSIWLQQRHAGLNWRGILPGTFRALPALGAGVALLLLLRTQPAIDALPPLLRLVAVGFPVLVTYAAGLALAYPGAARQAAALLLRRAKVAP